MRLKATGTTFDGVKDMQAPPSRELSAAFRSCFSTRTRSHRIDEYCYLESHRAVHSAPFAMGLSL